MLKGQGHFHFEKGTFPFENLNYGKLWKGDKAETRGNQGHGLCGLVYFRLVCCVFARCLGKLFKANLFAKQKEAGYDLMGFGW